MTGLAMTWHVRAGWADIELQDHRATARITASYVSNAPEDLLTAITQLLHGSTEARVQFEAEPRVYRWHFHRDHDEVDLSITEHETDHGPGTTVFSTRQPLSTLARTAVRCFDTVEQNDYEREWRRPFPHFQLEGLRRTWRPDAPTTT